MVKRGIASFLAMMFILGVVISALFSSVAFAQKDYSIIRVKLSNANDGTLNVTLDGDYTMGNGGTKITGELIVQRNGSNIVMTQKGTNKQLFNGKSVRLIRQADQSGNGLIRMYNKEHGWRTYLGDMDFSINNDGTFLVVNHLPMEHYLYGVVAYEMSNKFPLEALKAQSIAARGYAAGRIRGASYQYDLGDTPSDQVYKGFNAVNKNVIKAVDATQGQVLTYKGKIILAYYGSSNGGQTDLAQNAWSNEIDYCVIKDDPYDLRNPSSMVQKVFFPTQVSKKTPIDPTLEKFLKQQVLPTVKSKGHSTASNNVTIVGIKNLEATDSKFAEPSRSYTMAKATVRVRVTKNGNSNASVGDQPVEPTFTEVTDDNGDTVFINDSGEVCTIDEQQRLLDEYNQLLTEWEASAKSMGGTSVIEVPIKFTIYDLKDKTKGYRVFNNDNLRMYWSEKLKDGSGFNLVNVRFGHGVGMSQRGAQQMANEGLTYKDILHFYYENVKIETLDYRRPSLNEMTSDNSDAEPIIVVEGTASEATASIDEDVEQVTSIKSTAKPTVSPTSTATQEATATSTASLKMSKMSADDEEILTGTILETTGLFSSTVDSEPITTLPQNTKVSILAQRDDWLLVATNKGELGLVKTGQVSIVLSSGIMQKDALVLNQIDEEAFLGSAKKDAKITILELDNDYYRILTEDGLEGYVPTSSVSLTIVKPGVELDSALRFGYALKNADVYTEKTKSNVSFQLFAGQPFRVMSRTADGKLYRISCNGKEGYVTSSSVSLIKKGQNHYDIDQLIDNYFTTTRSAARAKVNLDALAETDSINQIESVLSNNEINMSISDDSDVFDKTNTDNATVSDEESFLASPEQKRAIWAENGNFREAFATTEIPGTVKGVTVNLRKSASTTSTIIRQLENGSTVSVLGQNGDFYKIRDARGNVGYVSKDLVVVNTKEVGLITADNVKLRKQASEKATALATLSKNDTVEVMGSQGSFFKVKLSDGTMGYVSDKYCKVGAVTIPTVNGGTSANTSSNKTGNTVKVTSTTKAVASGAVSSSVNMRASASMSAKVLKVIPAGTRVNIISKRGEFYRISYDGQIGFVAMSFIPTNTLKKPTSSGGTSNNSTTTKTGKKTAIIRNDADVTSQEGKKIGSVKKNDKVTVLGSSGTKYKVQKGDVVGYVEDKFVIVQKN